MLNTWWDRSWARVLSVATWFVQQGDEVRPVDGCSVAVTSGPHPVKPSLRVDTGGSPHLRGPVALFGCLVPQVSPCQKVLESCVSASLDGDVPTGDDMQLGCVGLAPGARDGAETLRGLSYPAHVFAVVRCACRSPTTQDPGRPSAGDPAAGAARRPHLGRVSLTWAWRAGMLRSCLVKLL